MQLQNVFTVPVPIHDAWELLLDPARVASCLPGAALESVNGDEMRGRVKVKLGSMSMLFRGHAEFVERDEATHSVLMRASGKDNAGAGGIKAEMRMSLAEVPEGTQCTVLTDLAVSGKAAQFGRGVMADVSTKLVGEFADRLARQVNAGPAGVSPADGDDALDLADVVGWQSLIRIAAPAVAMVLVGLAAGVLWRRGRVGR